MISLDNFKKERLSEIATLAIQGLIEDDSEQAYKYLKDTVDLNNEEMMYFGLCGISDELKNEITKVAEELGWKVDLNDNYVCFESFSPQGENVILEFGESYNYTFDDVLERIKEEYESFDVDQHVLDCYGMKGAPSSLKVLLKDAEDIEKMYEDLAIALSKINSQEHKDV